MRYAYDVFGLSLLSNVPIGSLPLQPAPRSTGTIRFDCSDGADALAGTPQMLPAPSVQRPVTQWAYARHEHPRLHEIEFADGTRMHVDAGGSHIWATGAKDSTVEDTATYLLGPVLAFTLRLRGYSCLHASAVQIGGKSMLFVGPSGAGKSSLAAAFALGGVPVVSDDVVTLQLDAGVVHAVPAFPRLRLWPASVRALFGSEDALPRITPTWDKRHLLLDRIPHAFAPRALPVGGIYFLEPHSSGAGAVTISALDPTAALLRLLQNTQGNYFVSDDMRAADFSMFAALAGQLPCKTLCLPAGLDGLAGMCHAIIDDAANSPSLGVPLEDALQ
jgi:hypothetical protein